MNNRNDFPNFETLFFQRPQAWARVRGDEKHAEVTGLVRFYETFYGTFVVAQISGLPEPEGKCKSPVFAFHIHEGAKCAGNENDPFADAGGHYNPQDCPHPYHAGDLPPLFGSHGYAFSAFLTDRFSVREVIGRTVIIHASLDDFTSQPSGNAGRKLACGEIVG